MANSNSTNANLDDQLENNIKELQVSLPKQPWFSQNLLHYQNFWSPNISLGPLIRLQTHFQARDDDIIVTSLPKTGTTWLKSLVFTIINRIKFPNSPTSQHPLHNKNPHELFFRFEASANSPNFTDLPSPRLFATHFPYQTLPESIRSSNCRIVYVCRNPIDTFVSTWHFCLRIKEFVKDLKPTLALMQELVTSSCSGVSPFGPYDEHLLGYWTESLKNPRKVFILEYEGLKKDPKMHLKGLADFLGCPFSEEEEEGGVVEEIIELCSFKSLKEMEVNKSGRFGPLAENNVLFRKGEVGDWSNDLTPAMAKQLDQILQGKLMNAGFSFKYYP